ncbi:MAG: NUDIX hydrolase [Chloroflexi bacterium]|nr:NUDIX hydrolase [Chloroflexota bacterium]
MSTPRQDDQPDAADEVLIGSEYIYQGRLLKMRLDRIRTDAGSTTMREIVEHPGAVAIVPLLPDGRVILVRQWRRPARRHILEIPAGTREPNEDAEACARRELVEEIGYRAGVIERLAGFFTTPGFTDEYMDLFLATELTPAADDEPAEFEEALVIVRPDDVPALIAAGEPLDAKTIAALLLVAARR